MPFPSAIWFLTSGLPFDCGRKNAWDAPDSFSMSMPESCVRWMIPFDLMPALLEMPRKAMPSPVAFKSMTGCAVPTESTTIATAPALSVAVT